VELTLEQTDLYGAVYDAACDDSNQTFNQRSKQVRAKSKNAEELNCELQKAHALAR